MVISMTPSRAQAARSERQRLTASRVAANSAFFSTCLSQSVITSMCLYRENLVPLLGFTIQPFVKKKEAKGMVGGRCRGGGREWERG